MFDTSCFSVKTKRMYEGLSKGFILKVANFKEMRFFIKGIKKFINTYPQTDV